MESEIIYPIGYIGPPDQVTMRQARLALLRSAEIGLTENLLAQIAPAIASLPTEQRSVAEIEWEFSSTVERLRPLVAMICTALGLTDEQRDSLFRFASSL